MAKILSLEMQGFKSFAHKTKIIFKSGLNVIVGPNGSGKSNIMDAICFVLGKTSKKEMRAEKMSHLIFNGGKGRKPMDFAKVVITFENNGDFPIKSKEVRVSRVVNKDGNTVFRINGERRTLVELVDILRKANVDINGFNIILQGEINKFVDLSANQRRMIIDDISGVSVYEEKKKRAVSELEKVEERVKDKKIVLAEKEKYLKELLKDKEYAESFLKLKEKLRLTKAKIILKKIENREREREEKERVIKALGKRKEELEKKIDSWNREYSSLEKEIEEIEEELGKRGQEKERELRDRMERTAIEIQKMENRVENYSKEISEIKERKRQISSEIKENEKKLEDMQREMERVKKEVSDINREIGEKKRFTREYSPYEIKKRIVVLERDIELLEKDINDMKRREKILDECKPLLKNTRQEKQDLEKKLGKLKEEMRSLASKMSEIEDYLRHLHKEKTELEAKLRNFMMSLNRGTKAIIALQHPGIIGNIMELIEYPENLSQAINSLAGARRNVIVVDNEDTAIWCINYLKSNRAGTATFLPLSRLEDIKLREKQGEGIIARVIDVVRYNPKYEKVVKWLFGDSLIIKNLSNAKNIKGFRLATPEGDIVEKSGLFRGGYKRKVIGPNKAEIDNKLDKISKEERRYSAYLKELEEGMEQRRMEIEKAEEKIRELEKKEMELELKIDEAGEVDSSAIVRKEMECKEKKEELEKLKQVREEEEFEKVSREIEELQKRLNELIVREGTFSISLKNIEEENRKMRNILEALDRDEKEFSGLLEKEQKNLKQRKKELSAMKKEQEKFFSKIKNLYEKREKLKKKLSGLNKKINEEEKRAYKLEQEKQKVELLRAEIIAKISGLEKEREEYGDVKISRVYENLKELEKKLYTLEKQLGKFSAVNMKALETYNEVKEEYDRLMSKIEMLEKEREEILGKMEEIDKEKKHVFMAAFDEVSSSLKRIYADLAEGEAKLVLENPENPFEGGMELIVKPKGKRFVPLRALSGGEKTIVAIAFIFAIQEYLPAPFYIFDEIDAALDKMNSQKLADELKRGSEKSQIIVITHNDEIVANADYLYGVSINKEGISKVVSIKIP